MKTVTRLRLAFTSFLFGFVVLVQLEMALAGSEPRVCELVRSINDFAFDLYQALRGEKTNLFYSPYSISLALAMTYAGARGDTEREMADVLHFIFPQARLHAAFWALQCELAARGGEGFRLYIANSIWGQAGHPFLSEFLTLIDEWYDAAVDNLDFRGDPEGSRKMINLWVSNETEGTIEDLILPGGITTLTRLVLANAVYFKAGWLYPFDKAETQDGGFYLLDNQEVRVPMMKRKARLGYAAGDGWEAVELPYKGGKTTMVLLLPDLGHFEEFESTLSAGRVVEIMAKLQKMDVCLTMPKFAYEVSLELKGTLTGLGMDAAFQSMKADFSGMDGTKDLYLDEVYHKARVVVDEAGTEAAAATAVVMVAKAAPVPGRCVEVSINRPFVLFIQDVRTNTILFVGRVLDPR